MDKYRIDRNMVCQFVFIKSNIFLFIRRNYGLKIEKVLTNHEQKTVVNNNHISLCNAIQKNSELDDSNSA